MLKLGNALELFKTLDDGSIDCIITDPPYPTISGGNGGADSSSTAQRPGGMLSKNDGKIFDYNDIDIRQWLPECYRILKPIKSESVSVYKVHTLYVYIFLLILSNI